MSTLDATVFMLGSLATLYFLMELHGLLRGSQPDPRTTPFAVRMDDGQPLEIWLEEPESADDSACRHCGSRRPSRAAAY